MQKTARNNIRTIVEGLVYYELKFNVKLIDRPLDLKIQN